MTNNSQQTYNIHNLSAYTTFKRMNAAYITLNSFFLCFHVCCFLRLGSGRRCAAAAAVVIESATARFIYAIFKMDFIIVYDLLVLMATLSR